MKLKYSGDLCRHGTTAKKWEDGDTTCMMFYTPGMESKEFMETILL